MDNLMEIKKTYWIEYAHRLPDHPGLCKYLHGHSGKIDIVFEGEVVDRTGMVYDFGKFEWLKMIVDELDHSLVLQGGENVNQDSLLTYLLNGIDERKIEPLRIVMLPCPPTAENIVLYLRAKIKKYISENTGTQLRFHSSFRLSSILFEETRKNEVTWRNDFLS